MKIEDSLKIARRLLDDRYLEDCMNTVLRLLEEEKKLHKNCSDDWVL